MYKSNVNTTPTQCEGMTNVITTQSLTKRYGMNNAVDNVTLAVPAGSICGLVGKNGAGKTTLMRIISGLIPSNSGTYAITPHRDGVAIAGIIETPSLHLSMTALDNLIIQSKLLGVAIDKGQLMSLLQLVDLERIADRQAKHLSLGMRQRLAIAICLVGNPAVLLLDEPTNGLDPQGIRAMRELFVKINQIYGVTILISSHILSELAKFATHYIFMDRGRVIKCCDASELDNINTSTTLLSTNDNTKAVEILAQNGYTDISIKGDNILLAGAIDNTAVILLLANSDIRVASLARQGDSLEDYFLQLIGGAQ